MISPQSITGGCSRHPWATVAVWLLALVAAVGVSATLLGDALTTDMDFTGDPESKQAEELIEERLRGPEQNIELMIVRARSQTVDDPEFRTYVEDLQQDVVALGPGTVAASLSYFQTNDPSLVSPDRRTTLMAVVLAGDDETTHEHIPHLRAVLDRHPSDTFEALLFGQHSIGWEFDEVAKDDMAKGETFGIVAALVILLVVFGAVLAGIVPILMALASIVIALGTVALVGQQFSFVFFVQNMIAMMGLALGIDYSLFVISRYREERGRGRDKLDAIDATGRTASRAVAFSGMTVVFALLGMLLVPMTLFRSLAAGAIFVALASILASLTLLPALLAILGDRINALRVLRHKGMTAASAGGFWDHVTHAVMRRPVTSVLLSGGVLALAAIPYLGVSLGFPGVSTLPEDTDARRAFAIMAEDFSGGLDSPVEIAIDADMDSSDVQAGIADLRAMLADDGAFGPSQVETNPAGDLAVVSAPTAGDPQSDASLDAIDRLRDSHVPDAFAGTEATVLVGGDTASDKDGIDIIDRYMPIVFLVVLGMSFVLLTVVFRSIVVAAKAIAMNLLSVGAAYGLLVLVTQEGVGAGMLGLRQVDTIADWIPLFLFSVLFGLSMDYHVFLLTRIREQYDRTGDNAGSVAYGLRTTAGIITGAALIMVAVFAGFASGELVMFQQMGFGLGLAILIDATIVRTILVPASMKLLGTWNWYLPGWLHWLPDLHVEGAAGTPTVHAPAPTPVTPAAPAPAAVARDAGAHPARHRTPAPPMQTRTAVDAATRTLRVRGGRSPRLPGGGPTPDRGAGSVRRSRTHR